MNLLKPSALTSELLRGGQSNTPIIICTDVPRVQKRIHEAGYQDVQINMALAKALLEYPQEDRPQRVEGSLRKILSGISLIHISSFEMLFDPRYEIDVLKIFCEQARVSNVVVEWPGQFIGGKLVYAHPDNSDYHEYNCDSLQITIVH